MSEEVIKVLDALAEKFGIAIDWTSANVFPYLQQLCGKYVRYEIVTSIVWMLVGICLLFIGKYVIGKAKYCWGKYKEDWHSDYDMATIGLGILAGCVIVEELLSFYVRHLILLHVLHSLKRLSLKNYSQFIRV